MIKSMTGFGRAELKTAHGLIRVEAKSTNHKFLDLSLRLPGHLAEHEEAVRRVISQEIRRGKIVLSVQCPDPSKFYARLVLNEALAVEVAGKIRRLKKILKTKEISSDENFILREVLHYPEVLVKDSSSEKKAPFFKELESVLRGALRNLESSRLQEGGALKNDFLKRLVEIKKAALAVEKRFPAMGKEFKKNLEKKAKELLPDGVPADRERLTLETALYLKNSDISEEITRLKSHHDAMKKAFGETGELGRKIDFIGQEMIREANTIGAKSSDVMIANHVIQIKSAIEKIREQSQNVE